MGSGLAMDNFRVTAVPEASTFLIGALGMLQFLKRRRQSSAAVFKKSTVDADGAVSLRQVCL